jgi:uncharacterized protein (DUF305 family)
MLKRAGFLMVLTAASAGCADRTTLLEPDLPQQSVMIAGAPAPSSSAINFEIRFMQDMIDHHMMAVMTAEICLDAAVHEELVATCQEIIATQTQEIETMQAWLSDWYGITYAPMMNRGMMKEVERLEELEGAEFEIAFMEMMIRHHEGAIKEASRCTKKAYHADLLAMCEDIIQAQAAEIAQMENWLCEWYDRCK